MKKIILNCLVLLLLTTVISAQESYDNTDYWDKYCETVSGESDSDSIRACNEYRQYVIDKAKNDYESLKNDLKEAKKDLASAQKKVKEYTSKIANLQVDIDKMTAKIEAIQVEIDKLVTKIKAKEDEVDKLNDQVLKRMANKQSIMHFNPFIDFILGASSFDQILRRSYGLNAIMESDGELKVEIETKIDELNKDKSKLDGNKDKLKSEKAKLDVKQEEFIALRDFQSEVARQSEEKMAEIQNQQEAANQLISDNLDKIITEVDKMPSSNGLIAPIQGSYISAGMPYYPASFGGGIHLGIDYAASFGTPIYAPANGVVIKAARGCADYEGLGSSCGWNIGGVSGGGNQIIMIMAAGGTIYGISFFHIQSGSMAVNDDDIVVQGQYLGNVGSSGNSTGPHAHIELFYLGKGEMKDIPDYLEQGYSFSFNCGWGSAALSRLCSNGVGAPCRLDGRDYF